MFRTRLRTPTRALAQSLRPTPAASAAAPFALACKSLHTVPKLPHDFSAGVPNLMSEAGFNLAWTDYMTLMTEKLNALTAGTLAMETGAESRTVVVPHSTCRIYLAIESLVSSVAANS